MSAIITYDKTQTTTQVKGIIATDGINRIFVPLKDPYSARYNEHLHAASEFIKLFRKKGEAKKIIHSMMENKRHCWIIIDGYDSIYKWNDEEEKYVYIMENI